MWREIDIQDRESARTAIEVMHQVDRAYRKLGPAFVQSLIRTKNGSVLLYEDGEDEIVYFLQPNPRMGIYRIFTAGHRGPGDPQKMLQIAVRGLLEFMRKRGLKQVYTIRRRGLDNQQMNDIFDALPKMPEVNVAVEHDLRDRVAWRIRAA